MTIPMPIAFDHPVLRTALPRIVQELQKNLGDDLVSLVLYGGLTTGEFGAASDVNLMIVLQRADIEVLDRLGTIIRGARREMPLTPLIQTEAELQHAADAFPIKYLDIQARHQLLAGRDVISQVSPPRAATRLRAEQEFRNILMRARQFYVLQAPRPEQIQALLCDVVSDFVRTLRAMLWLRDGGMRRSKTEVIEAAAELLALPMDAARTILAIKNGNTTLDPGGLRSLFSDYLLAVAAATDCADRLAE